MPDLVILLNRKTERVDFFSSIIFFPYLFILWLLPESVGLKGILLWLCLSYTPTIPPSFSCSLSLILYSLPLHLLVLTVGKSWYEIWKAYVLKKCTALRAAPCTQTSPAVLQVEASGGVCMDKTRYRGEKTHCLRTIEASKKMPTTNVLCVWKLHAMPFSVTLWRMDVV